MSRRATSPSATGSADGPPSPSPCEPSSVSIVLADDHRVFRSALRVLIEADGRFTVLAQSGNVDETVEAVSASRPQVLVLDLNMGGTSSLDAIPRLRSIAPETQIVVLTMEKEPAVARAALDAGAMGYVVKDAADSELMNAIVLAAQGRSYVHPELGARLAGDLGDHAIRTDRLSPREIEVLKLIALGHTNNEIAASLFLSVRTVESHRAKIQQKVRARSRSALVRYARDQGLVG